MSIIIGADLVPTESNYDLFEAKDLVALFTTELLEMLSNSDFRIFNLETPITDSRTPITKCGPALITPTRVVGGIKALGVDLFTIANNHILDQGEQGFRDTCKVLKDNEIDFVGGGNSVEEAQSAYIFEQKGKKIGVYACAEHEFSIATEESCGANPFDPLESLDHIAELKNECDYVIVLYHGGKEHYRYPSPDLKKICRKIVDKGADLVVCQHSHCIGCEDKYKNSTIVYGQGNFLFDRSNSEFWQTSLLVKINDDFSISYIPLVKMGNTVKLANTEDSSAILSDFFARSKEVEDDRIVKMHYENFSKNMLELYLNALSAVNTKNFFFRALNKLSGYRFSKWLLKKKYKKDRLIKIENFLECEAHRELLLMGLKSK